MALTILPPLPDTDYAPTHSRPKHHHGSSDTSASDSEGGMSLDSDDLNPRPTKRARLNNKPKPSIASHSIVVPGEPITDETQWMRGHGTTTTLSPTSTLITATLAGPITPTNKLLSVLPLRARYTPEVGDLVLGRIVSVEKSQWRVDVSAPLLAKLSMSSINLPGGALRRRTANDELQMRRYFQEGDLLVAEVQSVASGDGSATLHARSLRYGKLRNGVFVAVAGTGGGGGVVRSRRQQFTVSTAVAAGGIGGGEVDVILGVNGYVWLSKHIEDNSDVTGSNSKSTSNTPTSKAGGVDLGINNLDEAVSSEAYSSQNDMIEEGTRREIARLAEVIGALAEGAVRVDEEGVRRGYEVAVEVGLGSGAEVEMGGRELLDQEVRRRVVEGVLGG
ncbi:Exosome complex component rrp4 [Knufia fluminis]|uniref:Exosome complex component rrp4 n=1 Tax=Knufia fluminis TaxID=191047 RepID=A0AAN8FGD3_9EURO|nr:Exosome complex component rrp4 [Knufia fluminis]